MIRVHNVHKSFGSFYAVRGVTFDIPKGQCVGLLGPNGAGKTTTIRMLTGFIPPTAGDIAIDGHDTVSDSMGARRLVGYLPESTPLYPEMRVRDYLDHRARLFSVPRRVRLGAITAAAEQCRVAEVFHRRLAHLSKGYKQRVGLAATLVHDPPVLVLDEPTSGLDPSQIRETRSLIRSLAQNRTVLVSSHILPEVEKTCDRVIIIARGRVRADASPRRLVESASGPAVHTVEVHSPIAAHQERVLTALRAGLPQGVEVAMNTVGADSWTRFSIRPPDEHPDLREPILAALSPGGFRVRELHRAVPTLEQVFISLIEGEE
jgi:ABC-2 type transport system ATP-binding protein